MAVQTHIFTNQSLNWKQNCVPITLPSVEPYSSRSQYIVSADRLAEELSNIHRSGCVYITLHMLYFIWRKTELRMYSKISINGKSFSTKKRYVKQILELFVHVNGHCIETDVLDIDNRIYHVPISTASLSHLG